MAKNLVFGSDFMIYGAPFYKWYRFTYGAVTDVQWSGSANMAFDWFLKCCCAKQIGLT